MDAGEAMVIRLPAEEPHRDSFGRRPDGDRHGRVRQRHRRGLGLQGLGRPAPALRIERELQAADAFTPLALEGLALELTAVARRGPAPARPGRWIEQAHELLHERFRETLTVTEVAS